MTLWACPAFQTTVCAHVQFNEERHTLQSLSTIFPKNNSSKDSNRSCSTSSLRQFSGYSVHYHLWCLQRCEKNLYPASLGGSWSFFCSHPSPFCSLDFLQASNREFTGGGVWAMEYSYCGLSSQLQDSVGKNVDH